METKKQEAIRLVYGDKWEKVKDLVDDNGFINVEESGGVFGLFMEDELDTIFPFFRPKSLSGIEDNRGWISIESEDDLPKHLDLVWLIDPEFGTDIGYYNEKLKKWYSDTVEQFPTHYQPIIKPSKPIY